MEKSYFSSVDHEPNSIYPFARFLIFFFFYILPHYFASLGYFLSSLMPALTSEKTSATSPWSLMVSCQAQQS